MPCIIYILVQKFTYILENSRYTILNENLFSQLVKLESTSLVIKTAALVTLWDTCAAVIITSEVLSSFTSCKNRYSGGVLLACAARVPKF